MTDCTRDSIQTPKQIYSMTSSFSFSPSTTLIPIICSFSQTENLSGFDVEMHEAKDFV